jgi:hypothetical protein
MEEQVVYEKEYGEETYGEVRLRDGIYRCYATSQFGGEFNQEGGEYDNIEEAIKFIESLT